MKLVRIAAVAGALTAVCIFAINAWATRSAGGTYSLASPGVPFQSGQVISSTQVNNTFNDIATTLTDSLDRNGKGGMLFALRGIDGIITAPAFSWTSETNSGLWRAAAGDVRLSILGTVLSQWNATGLGIGIAATVPLQVQKGATGTSPAVFQSSVATDATVSFLSGVNNSGIDLNAKNGLYSTASTAGAFAIHGDNVNGSTGFYTGPAGVAGNAVSYTERLRVGPLGITVSAPGFATGIPNNGSGFKHARVTGCTTTAGAGGQCAVTVTWTTAFADANYTATCQGFLIAGIPGAITTNSKLAASLQVFENSAGAGTVQMSTIDCIAVHD